MYLVHERHEMSRYMPSGVAIEAIVVRLLLAQYGQTPSGNRQRT